MKIDLNLLKRLIKRFGVMPLSKIDPKVSELIQNPEHFIKAPAGFEPAITGGGYQWDDSINGYRLGQGQKIYLLPNGIAVWTFKDVLARILAPDRIQKWVSADDEYPMGKANAFLTIYGKMTGQDLGQGDTAGDEVPEGEDYNMDDGGLATADDPNAPAFSKQDIQKMLKGEFPNPADNASGPSMDTAIPGAEGEPAAGEEPEASAPMSGPPPSRLSKGEPKAAGSEADNIINTLYKLSGVNPKLKLSKQNPIRLDSDKILDLYQKAKNMSPEEGEKIIAFLKSGAVKPLEEGKIAKSQLESLVEYIVSGVVSEVDKAKKKTKSNRADAEKAESEPEHSQMDWEPSGEQPDSGMRDRKSIEKWIESMAEKLWKDPTSLGKGSTWRIAKTHNHPDGPVYLVSKSKRIDSSRIFANRNGEWYYFNPEADIQDRKWKPVGEQPETTPSIEQENANDDPWDLQSHYNQEPDKQIKPWKPKPSRIPVSGTDGPPTGSTMKPIKFNKTTQRIPLGQEFNPKLGPPKEREPAEPDDKVDEMTTTSGGGGSSAGTSGYNIPGAFSGNRMKNRKGHIEVLGYKMTPEGEKEYAKHGDKLYESVKSVLKGLKENLVPKPEGGKCPHCGKDIWSKDAMRCSSCKRDLPPKAKKPQTAIDVGPLENTIPQRPQGGICSKCGKPIWSKDAMKCSSCGAPVAPKEKPVAATIDMGPLQQEASGLGPDFDRAQRAYDNQMPPNDPGEIECPECGQGAHFTHQDGQGSSKYSWEAECPHCGNTWGDGPEPEDNL